MNRGDKEWTEVQQRKGPTHSGNESDVNRNEIKKAFARHGTVSDVFFPGKKGRNGSYYLFIRYLGVKDTHKLEKAIDGTIYRGRKLSVNLDKYRRKENTCAQAPRSGRNNGGTTANQTPGFRDRRNFAEVVRPIPPSQPTSSMQKPTIILQPDPETDSRLRKSTLVGEALSLAHLGHMKSLLSIKEIPNFEIKYIGGHKVLLVFDHSVGAKEFMENCDRWKEYMKWVKLDAVADSMKYDRVAWIRIVGLPLRYWGEKNFLAITAPFGETIAPYDDLPNRVDMSCVKIGILTEIRKSINDEIMISIDGELTKIGIIEFDEDYFPFRFNSVTNPYESEDENDETEDGVSDTWMQDEKDEALEDGEIDMRTENIETMFCNETVGIGGVDDDRRTERIQNSGGEDPAGVTHTTYATPPHMLAVESSPREVAHIKPNGKGILGNSPNKYVGSTEANKQKNQNGATITSWCDVPNRLPNVGCFRPFPSN
ncbi:unnamed protein product [Lactuca virosa]|uniref:RRM domain-containing protein n=1 Tax=Lactuca virosa TaxID=75947 RepID=A0AAU9PQ84_9ASTR|nr:unnamed protein product [Lactuca virosa]